MVPGPFFMSGPQPQSPFPDPVIAFHTSPNSLANLELEVQLSEMAAWGLCRKGEMDTFAFWMVMILIHCIYIYILI